MTLKIYQKSLLLLLTLTLSIISQSSFAASGSIISNLQKAYRAAESVGGSVLISGYHLIEGDTEGLMGVYKSLGRETKLLGRSYRLGFEQEAYRQGADEYNDIITIVPIPQTSNLSHSSYARRGAQVLVRVTERVAAKLGIRHLISDPKRITATLDFKSYAQFEMFLSEFDKAVQQSFSNGELY